MARRGWVSAQTAPEEWHRVWVFDDGWVELPALARTMSDTRDILRKNAYFSVWEFRMGRRNRGQLEGDRGQARALRDSGRQIRRVPGAPLFYGAPLRRPDQGVPVPGRKAR